MLQILIHVSLNPNLGLFSYFMYQYQNSCSFKTNKSGECHFALNVISTRITFISGRKQYIDKDEWLFINFCFGNYDIFFLQLYIVRLNGKKKHKVIQL